MNEAVRNERWMRFVSDVEASLGDSVDTFLSTELSGGAGVQLFETGSVTVRVGARAYVLTVDAVRESVK